MKRRSIRSVSVSRQHGRVLAGGVCLLLALLMLPTSAKAWWQDDWALRKKITIDTSATGAGITEPIGAPGPILIRLHSGNFHFEGAKDDGSDLRFVAGDDKTPLKFHVEKYDSLLGEALIWVKVPDLKPGAKTDIWLYYGNKKAPAAADAKGSYDADTSLVYHFSENNIPPQDSTVWANNALSAGLTAEGALIGRGERFDGTNAVTLPGTPSLSVADGGSLTVSLWFNMVAPQPNAVLYRRDQGADGLLIGLDNGVPFVQVTKAGAVQRTPPGTAVAAASWHNTTVVADGSKIVLYLDGASYATVAASLPAMSGQAFVGGVAVAGGAAPAAAPAASPAAAPAPTATPAPEKNSPSPAASPPPAATPAPAAGTNGQATSDDGVSAPAGAVAPAAAPAAGAAPTGPAPAAPAAGAAATAAPQPATAAGSGFVGDFDELEISKVARPPGFVKLAVMSQGSSPGKLITYLKDEEASTWLSGYLAVILRSVTLDGWVVIGLLAIMAVISWVVMVDRVSYIGRQTKANASFIERFRACDELTALDRGDDVEALGEDVSAADKEIMADSSLYRIYQAGAEEIRRRFESSAAALSPQALAVIKAGIDSRYVKETQKLNRLIVVLTIAISGGPFLGLLGTVVGVMITFAAIAESGDVNVNAIAPGIAAALVATVAGLIVAIPALFGYNYIITRISDLTSDMQVFIDEFITRAAESYQHGGTAPRAMAAE